MSSRDGRAPRETDVVALDVGGVVGISLVHPDPRDLSALRRQLGSMSEPLGGRAPDIEIEYVDGHPTDDLRLIGDGDAATDGDAFYMWGDGRDRPPIRVDLGRQLPFRLQVPHGSARIPILVQVVSAAALQKGYIPLHASAFRWRERGVLLAGWSKGGKSEGLLSFMERGATYVGDEWLFLSPDEPIVGGIPEPIRIWDWHLDELPVLRGRIGAGPRSRLAGLRGASTALRKAAHLADWRMAHKVADLVAGQRYMRADPARLFGSRRCERRSRIHAVFLMVSSRSERVTVEPADPIETAGRISASTTFEHIRLLEAELKREYAQPDRGMPLFDALGPTREALTKHLADLPVFEVVHPYPVSTASLYRAIEPVLAGMDP